MCVCMLCYYEHPCSAVLNFHDESWLQMQRSRFSNSRNSLFAGQTGTRSVGGRPQQRFEAGVILAKSLKQQNPVSGRTQKPLSVGLRIRNAVAAIRGSLPNINPSGDG